MCGETQGFTPHLSILRVLTDIFLSSSSISSVRTSALAGAVGVSRPGPTRRGLARRVAEKRIVIPERARGVKGLPADFFTFVLRQSRCSLFFWIRVGLRNQRTEYRIYPLSANADCNRHNRGQGRRPARRMIFSNVVRRLQFIQSDGFSFSENASAQGDRAGLQSVLGLAHFIGLPRQQEARDRTRRTPSSPPICPSPICPSPE